MVQRRSPDESTQKGKQALDLEGTRGPEKDVEDVERVRFEAINHNPTVTAGRKESNHGTSA